VSTVVHEHMSRLLCTRPRQVEFAWVLYPIPADGHARAVPPVCSANFILSRGQRRFVTLPPYFCLIPSFFPLPPQRCASCSVRCRAVQQFAFPYRSLRIGVKGLVAGLEKCSRGQCASFFFIRINLSGIAAGCA
jgi:hypothetical protein